MNDSTIPTRVAVVEDDQDLSQLIREALRESGHDVVSYFKPSPDIVESFRSYRPTLIILDLRLNSYVNGWEIITALKADDELKDIPVILSTGAVDQVAANRAWLEAHGVPLLTKPFDISDLDALVERMLASTSQVTAFGQ